MCLSIQQTLTDDAHLPVLSDGIPHSNLSCVACRHQLVANEEEVINRNAEAEYT